MKKILFTVALLIIGTSLVEARSSMEPETSRGTNIESLGILQPVKPVDKQGEFNGADRDELSGEEQEVTEAEESY